MRRLLLAPAFAAAFAALPAQADPLALSREIGTNGIAATAARLSDLPAPAAEELFAAAGLRFLSGIEQALQLRWQTGLEADWSELPILRLPIPANPAPRPFTGADLETMLQGVSDRMEAAREPLSRIDGDFGLEIDLADLWFDINANGARDPGEDLTEVAGVALGLPGIGAAPPGQVVIRFDGSDAAWLEAYSHLLAGLSKLALAYGPAEATDRILNATGQMHALWGDTPPPNAWDMMFGKQVDRIAIILKALEQKPDAALAASAYGDFQEVIAANRRFWTLVMAETDDDREWVPNEGQTSALGIRLPPGTISHWQGVLAEAEQLLKGEILMPHWRYGAEAGISLKKLFDDPPPVDLVGMIQGEALLPYAEKGKVMSGQAWRDFERLMQGEAVLFAVFFN